MSGERGEHGGGRSLPWEGPFNWAKTLRPGSPLQGKWRAGLHYTHTLTHTHTLMLTPSLLQKNTHSVSVKTGTQTHTHTHTHTPKPSLVIGPAAPSSKLLASGWPWRWEEKREVLKSCSPSQTTPNIIHEYSSDSCMSWAETLNTQPMQYWRKCNTGERSLEIHRGVSVCECEGVKREYYMDLNAV